MSTTAQTLAGKRIEALLDENSFVEIGALVTARSTDFNLQQKETPSDGVITGYGVIDGNLVYVYSQDASVLHGTLGEMHAKKITKLYDLALKMGAPVIGLVDCAGLRLQEATDALNGFGEIYRAQALASGVVPQITAVFGTCGGGLAVIPGLTDFTFMEESKAKLFVNSPNAIEGNEVSRCDSASAKFQSEETGLVDVVADEAGVLSQIRQLVAMLPANNEDDASYEECLDDLNRVCEDLGQVVYEAPYVLSSISDSNVFFETKAAYGKDMVTGFIRLNGMTVGAVANNAQELSARGARKAAEFVKFCDAFNIPVLTLTNVKGYGSAYVAMNSKGLGADVVYAWTDAQIGMMDAKLAVKIMYADADAAAQKEKAAEYASLQSSAEAAAKRGYVDSIIEAKDTRKYVIGAFEMLFTKREDRPAKKHGTV